MIWGTGKLPMFIVARMVAGFALESQTSHLTSDPAAKTLPLPSTTEMVREQTVHSPRSHSVGQNLTRGLPLQLLVIILQR